jgi:hypothetical protein
MIKRTEIDYGHPLRELFRNALAYSFELNPTEKIEISYYIEEQILCGFINVDDLYRIKNAEGQSLDDIADMLAESDVMINAESFEREYQVHKHIGDYTLFMLGMFPTALSRKRGKEFVLGSIVVPGANLLDHYMLQGQRSYRIASEFSHKELFMELSSNFEKYQAVIELVRTYLQSINNCDLLKSRNIIGGTG